MLKKLLTFLLLMSKSYLHILNKSPLSDIYMAHIFSESVLFYLNITITEGFFFLLLMTANWSVFSLTVGHHTIGLISKKCLPNKTSKRLSSPSS